MSGLSDTQIDDQLRLFYFHCLENVIHQNYYQLSAIERQTIRDHCWKLFRASRDAGSRLQCNKLAQLIAVFGKRQFPVGEHDDYDKQIKHLLEERTTFILGVILVRANCEELLNTRSDVTVLMRETFSQAMAKCLTGMLPILNQSLLVLIDAQSPEFQQFAGDIFSCIQAIIQCDVIEDHYLSNIVTDLFTISKVGESRLAVQAIETLNELFCRQRIFKVHDVIAKGVVEVLRAAEKPSESYESALIQLLQAASKHLTVEWWSKVSYCSLENYLELLWSFTTKNEEPMTFCEKLACWSPILHYYSENCAVSFPESLINVAKLTLNRMMLQYNQNLVEIYDVLSEESDWSSFVRSCLDIVAIMSQIQPVAMFELVCTEVAKPHGPLDIFGNLVTKTHPVFLQMLNDNHNVAYIRLMLRDLATQSQILARTLPPIKANLEDTNQLKRLDEIITKVIEIAHLLLLHIAQMPTATASDHPLTHDVIAAEAQLFNSIIYLFPISTTLTNNQGVIVDVFDNAVHFILQRVHDSGGIHVQRHLLAALAEFLRGIVVELRQKFLMDGRSIVELMKADFNGKFVVFFE